MNVGIKREERRHAPEHVRDAYREQLKEKPQMANGENGNGRGLTVSIPMAILAPALTAAISFFTAKQTGAPTIDLTTVQAQVTVLQGHQDDLIRRVGWIEERIKEQVSSSDENGRMLRRIIDKIKAGD